jgi:hypothetical protein
MLDQRFRLFVISRSPVRFRRVASRKPMKSGFCRFRRRGRKAVFGRSPDRAPVGMRGAAAGVPTGISREEIARPCGMKVIEDFED